MSTHTQTQNMHSKGLTNLPRESDLNLESQIHWQSQITCPEPFLCGEQLLVAVARYPGVAHSVLPSGWSAGIPQETKHEEIAT